MARLITFDMDGTLLSPDHTISEKNLAAIRKCSEHGKQVALCTGRSVSELREYFPVLLPYVRYAICVSGALCWDLLKNRKICSDSIGTETALRAMEIAEPFSPMIHFLSDTSIMQKSHWEHLSDYHMEQYTEMYRREAEFVEDITALYRKNPWPLEKLNFYNRSEESRAALEEEIRKAALPVEMRHAEITSLELSPKGVTKGTGLLSLCRFLSIHPSDVVSVGDAENDVDAFLVSGTGVAMGNAPESVKRQAGFVTRDNAHDGCALAIEKFMLQS